MHIHVYFTNPFLVTDNSYELSQNNYTWNVIITQLLICNGISDTWDNIP
jgi:hypothetical protein